MGLDDDEEEDRRYPWFVSLKILRVEGFSESSVCCHLKVDGRRCVGDKRIVWTSGQAFDEIGFDADTNICIEVVADEKALGSVALKPETFRRSRSGSYPNAWFPVTNGIALKKKEKEASLSDSDEEEEDENVSSEERGKLQLQVLFFPCSSSQEEEASQKFMERRALKKKERGRRRPLSMKRLTAPKFQFVWGQEPESRIFELIEGAASPVTLHVYDVGHSQWIGALNRTTEGFVGGVFHAAIEVLDREYSFGASRTPGECGVFACRPRRCPLHTYRESVYLGDSSLSKPQVTAILRQIRKFYMGTSYDALSYNCCHFARDFAKDLGVGDLPNYIDRLANVGKSLNDALTLFNNDNNCRAITEEDAVESVVAFGLPDYDTLADQVNHCLKSPVATYQPTDAFPLIEEEKNRPSTTHKEKASSSYFFQQQENNHHQKNNLRIIISSSSPSPSPSSS